MFYRLVMGTELGLVMNNLRGLRTVYLIYLILVPYRGNEEVKSHTTRFFED